MESAVTATLVSTQITCCLLSLDLDCPSICHFFPTAYALFTLCHFSIFSTFAAVVLCAASTWNPPPGKPWQQRQELRRANFLSAAHRWHSFNYCRDRGGRQGLSQLKPGSVWSLYCCPRGWGWGWWWRWVGGGEVGGVGGGWYLSYSIASIRASADNRRLAFFVAVLRGSLAIWPEYWMNSFDFFFCLSFSTHTHTHLTFFHGHPLGLKMESKRKWNASQWESWHHVPAVSINMCRWTMGSGSKWLSDQTELKQI